MDTKVLNYRVNIESDSYADGKSCYMATCPTLNITDSGDTIEEAIEHIQEAIQLTVKVLVADKKPVPVDKKNTLTTNLSIKSKVYNHAPSDYHCPLCLGVKGIENEHTLLLKQDLVCQDKQVSAFINSFWIKNNPGHVIIVPNQHYENIYDLPDELAGYIVRVAKQIAVAMKSEYKCDGVTTLQNNEPAGGQHAFHYHFHIFPRYEGDDLHQNMGSKQLADPKSRLDYAIRLHLALSP